MVDIKIKTTSDVGDGGEICDDEGMIISAFDATRYEWFPAADVDNANSPTPLASPHRTTTFMVVAYEGSCIPDTNYVKVIVHPKPTVKASGEATIIAGKSTPIDASGDLIKTFLWTPSESLTCADCPSPMASPTKTTVYNITAFTDFGCADSAKVTIHVVCDNSQLFIPNTFTPNGDGQNDIFYPRGVGLDELMAFRVYNRWGEVVYSRTNVKLNDKTNGWDGTFKGKELSPDVFVYTVEAQCHNGEVLKLKGDITLVR
jgi:gliding motility-associated-like protein